MNADADTPRMEEVRARLSNERGLAFRDQLRDARYAVLADGEDASPLLFAFERLGSFLLGKIRTLSHYEDVLSTLAAISALDPPRDPAFHSSFSRLFRSVMQGRNDALHQGAFARHLAQHAVELALILEDAIMDNRKFVHDYMVRSVVSAELWQPFSFIRHTMLANSFSFLPIPDGRGRWTLISDDEVVRFLRFGRDGALLNKEQRSEHLAMTVEQAIEKELFKLSRAPRKARETSDLYQAFGDSDDGRPVLVVRQEAEREVLMGILTTFDVL